MRTSAAASARRRKTRRSPTKAPVAAIRPQDDVSTLIATWTPTPGTTKPATSSPSGARGGQLSAPHSLNC